MLKYFNFKNVFNLGEIETFKTLLDSLGQSALIHPPWARSLRLKSSLSASTILWKWRQTDTLITALHPAFLLQLSFRKIQNSTAVQKQKCTRAVRRTGSSIPSPVTTERYSDHLKPTLEKNRFYLRSQAPTTTEKVYNAGRNSAGLCRQKLKKVKLS